MGDQASNTKATLIHLSTTFEEGNSKKGVFHVDDIMLERMIDDGIPVWGDEVFTRLLQIRDEPDPDKAARLIPSMFGHAAQWHAQDTKVVANEN